MLTVITIVADPTPKLAVERSKSTVAAAIAQAGFPVEHLVVPWVPGSIGAALAPAVAAAKYPYFAMVDDDDWVLPNAFSVLAEGLKGNATAVCARELRRRPNGSIVPATGRHHLSAFRKDAVASVDIESWKAIPLAALLKSVQGTALDVQAWVYIYNRTNTSVAMTGVYAKYGLEETMRLNPIPINPSRASSHRRRNHD